MEIFRTAFFISSRKFALILLCGQAISVTVTGLGVFSTLLDNHTGKDISSTLTAGAYYILSATVGPYIACKPGFVDKIKQHLWKFIILGLADVYATYLQTLAFKYTSVASNQAITNVSVTIFVAILSLFMIKTRYKLIHYSAMLTSSAGTVIVILEDLNGEEGKNPFIGDMICIGAGFCVAVITVGEEFMIKGEISVLDFMAMLSFSGAIITGIQVCILDRVKLVEMEWDLQSVLYFLGYHACNTSYYFFVPITILLSSSMVASLSLLTAIAYSLLFAVFIFDNKFSIFYIGGLVVILVGLVMYNVKVAPEGGTDQSVFSIGYWYNYGHSLFCEWRCCPLQDKVVQLIDGADDQPLISDHVDYQAININDNDDT
ncbi:solute carrier family 35 member F1-like [Dysidea avara]|uniref:solute carrier family 35 member F1-like n=1 Tax=Dysidea avara TaxID=196820 RepID=UPI003320B2EA